MFSKKHDKIIKTVIGDKTMGALEELQKYVVRGSVNEELIREQDENNIPKENPKPSKEEAGDVMLKEDLTRAVRKVLAEALLGECGPEMPYNPEAEVDPKIKKSEALLRVVQDAIYKLRDSQRKTPGQDEDEDIAKMMSSMNEPVIKMAIAKLYDIWYRGAPEEKKEKEAEVTIVPGAEFISPQGIEYKVESVSNGKVALKETGTGKLASADASSVQKWSKK
jgi:hypothetical protein